MELSEYQKIASTGAITPECSKGRTLVNMILALNGEAAAYTDLLQACDPTLSQLASELQKAAMKLCAAAKSTVFHRPTDPEGAKKQAREALGDLLRTTAASATCLGFNLDEIANESIKNTN